MGSTVKHWVGIGLTIGGGLSLASAAYYLLAPPTNFHHSDGTPDHTFDHVVGIAELVTGVVLAVVGVTLIAGGSTSVDVR
jgi:hypothetical protein